MPRPSFDAQVHLHSSKQPNAKANDWIVKLGLLPVNEGYLSGKPKFEQGSAEYSLYETTQDATNSMADDYSLEYLESSWASSDSFIDGVVKDILDRHQDVWAQPGVRNRREQAVGPSYPQKLDINNKDHRERIRIYLFCWILNRALKKKRRQKMTSDANGDRECTEQGSGRKLADYQRVGKGPVLPPQPNQGNIMSGVANAPTGELSSPSSRSPDSMYTPSEHRTPVANMFPVKEVPTPISMTTTGDPLVGLDGSRVQGPPPDEAADYMIPILYTVDNTDDDPDYHPTGSGKGKRRIFAAPDQPGKLRKVKHGQLKGKGKAELPSNQLSEPSPSRAFSGTEDSNVKDVFPYECVEPTEEADVNSHFVNGSPTLRLPERRRSETLRADPGLDIQHGFNNGPGPGAASAARTPDHAPSLFRLLLQHLNPNGAGIRSDLERLIALLEQCWNAKENDLQCKFSDEYHECQAIFNTWIDVLKSVCNLWKDTGFCGRSADEWRNYCASLPNKMERLLAVCAQEDMRAQINGVRNGKSSSNFFEQAPTHLAHALHAIAEMGWYPAEDLADWILEYNQAVCRPWLNL